MKYTLEIMIKKPVHTVISLFSNPDLLPYWQEGFVSYKHLKGSFGEVGSVNQLHFKLNKRNIILDEAIEILNLPENFTATYTTKGIWNRNINRFKALDENTTMWISHNEFKFLGFYKIISPIIAKAIKKQSEETLQSFKKFVEKN